jgi:hypothetical protein
MKRGKSHLIPESIPDIRYLHSKRLKQIDETSVFHGTIVLEDRDTWLSVSAGA